jgi:hypothetical protein
MAILVEHVLNELADEARGAGGAYGPRGRDRLDAEARRLSWLWVDAYSGATPDA